MVLLADCKRASVTKKNCVDQCEVHVKALLNSDTLFLGGGDGVKQVRSQRVSSSY